MKKYIAIIAVFAALAGYVRSQEAIDVMINDADFKDEVIEQVNALVANESTVTFTNTVAASVTNLSIVVIEGKVASVTINGSTTP